MVSYQEIQNARQQNLAIEAQIRQRQKQLQSQRTLRQSQGAEGVQSRTNISRRLSEATQNIRQNQQEISNVEQYEAEQSKQASLNQAIRDFVNNKQGASSSPYQSLSRQDRQLVNKVGGEIQDKIFKESVRTLSSEAINKIESENFISLNPQAKAAIEKNVENQLKSGKSSIEVKFNPISSLKVGGRPMSVAFSEKKLNSLKSNIESTNLQQAYDKYGAIIGNTTPKLAPKQPTPLSETGNLPGTAISRLGNKILSIASNTVQPIIQSVSDYVDLAIPEFSGTGKQISAGYATRGTISDQTNYGNLRTVKQRFDDKVSEIVFERKSGSITKEEAQSKINDALDQYRQERSSLNLGTKIVRGAIKGAAIVGLAETTPIVGIPLTTSFVADLASQAIARSKGLAPSLTLPEALETGAFIIGGIAAGKTISGVKGSKTRIEEDNIEEVVPIYGNARDKFIKESNKLSGEEIKYGKETGTQVVQVNLKDGRKYVIVKYDKGYSIPKDEGIEGRTNSAIIGFEIKEGGNYGKRIFGQQQSFSSGDISEAYTRAIIFEPKVNKGNFIQNLLQRTSRTNRAEIIDILERIQKLQEKKSLATSTYQIRSISRSLNAQVNKLMLLDKANNLTNQFKKGRKFNIKDAKELFNLDRISNGKRPFSEDEFRKAGDDIIMKGVENRILNRFIIKNETAKGIARFGKLGLDIKTKVFERKGLIGRESGEAKSLVFGKFKRIKIKPYKEISIRTGKNVGIEIGKIRTKSREYKKYQSDLVNDYKKAQKSQKLKSREERFNRIAKKQALRRQRQIQELKQRTKMKLMEEAKSFPGTALQIVKKAEAVPKSYGKKVVKAFAKVGVITGGSNFQEAAEKAFGSRASSGLRYYEEEVYHRNPKIKPNISVRVNLGEKQYEGNQYKVNLRESQNLSNKNRVKLGEATNLGERQRQSQTQLQRQEQTQRQRQSQKTTFRNRTETNLKTRTIPPIIGKGNKSSLKSKRLNKPLSRFKKYDAFVKRKGKEVRVTRTPTTKKAARGIGLKVADTTLAASVILRESKRPGFYRNRAAEREGQRILSKFRPSKRYANVLVEKPRFRLEKKGRTPEVREIKSYKPFRRRKI